MKTKPLIISTLVLLIAGIMMSCDLPEQKNKKQIATKKNVIILLDLSDRIIVQDNQPERDKEIIRHIYSIFEENVKKNLYIKSRDEIRVVIAPQRGARLSTETFEDRLYIDMEKINIMHRKSGEEERRNDFFANLDTLYRKAIFSRDPEDYYGADIWQYFYEDLAYDYVSDTLTKNYLFILTDGYPIVGKNPSKLQPIKNRFPDLQTIIVEAAPREKDLEWDRIMSMWNEWFEEISIPASAVIKRQAISKEKEMIAEIIGANDREGTEASTGVGMGTNRGMGVKRAR
ncbi:MAG TPA: hypothetical protein VI583_12260 [Cyclobacteriaceae bacterium]|nr:hypothetical protein [Cyclobacteriaceae bacterium]